MKPNKYLLAILPLLTLASITKGRSYPENVSPLHRRLARNEVYAVNALTYDDIPDGLRSEFSEDDVNDTVEEVQKLLDEDPTLPRLTRAEILALFDNVTRAEKQEKETLSKIKENLVATTLIPEIQKDLEKGVTVNKNQENSKSEDSDERIILETIGIVNSNLKKVTKHDNKTNTRIVLLDENQNSNNISNNNTTPIPATIDSKGVYVVLPDNTKHIEQNTFTYNKNTAEYENYESHTERFNSNNNNHDDSQDYITEFADISKDNIKRTTTKPKEVIKNENDQFHIDIEKISELTSSSFEDNKNRDVFNVNLGIRGVMKNQEPLKTSTIPVRSSIRYYDQSSKNRHSNHKYSDEDITDTTTIQKGPVYITTTVKPIPKFESTGKPFSIPPVDLQNYVRFQPVLYTSSPPITSTSKPVTENIQEFIESTSKPFMEIPKASISSLSFERMKLPTVRPETYAKFRPLPKVDPKLSKDMEGFFADFGLLHSSQNRINRKLTTPTPTTPSTNVFKPANATRVSLEKLTQLLEAVKQLENINATLTNEDLDAIADKLEALGIGARHYSRLSLGPNPLSDRYNIDSNKNEIKRQQPNATEEIFKVDLLGKNNTTVDQLSQQTEGEPKVVNSAPSTTTTTTTAKPDLLALEESFGAPIDPSTIDEELPPPRKNGLYFLADWNSFLEVGEDNKDKVVIRFDPKVGDPSRFIPVTVP